MTAAERKTFMECSLPLPATYHRAERHAKQAGLPSEPVRLAGSRRLRPVVPDRTAFGAATEGDTQRDRAENQYQSPEHGRATPPPSSYGLKSGIFKPRLECPFSANALRMPICTRARTAFMQHEQQTEQFDIEEARRVLGDVFAPWV